MGCEAQATGRGKRETSVVGTELPYQHQTWTPGGRPARSAAAAERGRGGWDLLQQMRIQITLITHKNNDKVQHDER